MITIGYIVNCENCGKEFYCTPKRYLISKHHCCSRECAKALAQKIREEDPNYLNCTCVICGKKFHLKQSQVNKYPTHTCSKECHIEDCRRRMTGENNHQFGVRGEENSIEIDGVRYLSPDYHVHHIDQNKQNNDVSNLKVMRKGDHIALHNFLNPRDRNNLGQFLPK